MSLRDEILAIYGDTPAVDVVDEIIALCRDAAVEAVGHSFYVNRWRCPEKRMNEVKGQVIKAIKERLK